MNTMNLRAKDSIFYNNTAYRGGGFYLYNLKENYTQEVPSSPTSGSFGRLSISTPIDINPSLK